MEKLLTIYQQAPSATFLSHWSKVESNLSEFKILFQMSDDELKSLVVTLGDEVETIIHYQGPIPFDFEIPYQKLSLAQPIYKKIQFEKHSPFQYQESMVWKAVHDLKDLPIEASDPINNISIHWKAGQELAEEYQSDFNDRNNFVQVTLRKEDRIIGQGIAEIDEVSKEAFISQYFFENKLEGTILFINLLSNLKDKADFVTITWTNSIDQPFFESIGFHDVVEWHVLTRTPRILIASYSDLKKKRIEISKTGIRPRLLLHSCCGPCSSAILADLAKDFELSIFYYNPNIYPESEYIVRLGEQKKIINYLQPNTELIAPIYQPNEYYQAIKGLEQYEEGSLRCFACYEMRLRKAAIYAKQHGFDFFTTTLSISPYKNADKINEIGQRLAQEYDIPFLYSNFKLQEGYKKSVALSKQYQIYRQDYCGCIYSKLAYEKRQNEKKNQ